MPSLWFIVPVHGRAQLASICLRQLRRTCDLLGEHGVEATACVIGSAEDLNGLDPQELGFAEVERDNYFTSRKFNDGIQLACDPDYNPRPADYVVPCGSDDWVDFRLFLDLPSRGTVVGFQRMAFVTEDGREISTHFLNYPGGSGIRIYSRNLMKLMGYRPAEEDRRRGCDTSILTNLRRKLDNKFRLEHRHLHDYQIVDWKSPGEQLNSHREISARYRKLAVADPFEALAAWYPAEALEEMQAHYARDLVAA